MARREMPIFTRTFDMLAWLLEATNNFPRSYRHSFTQRLLDAASSTPFAAVGFRRIHAQRAV